MSFESENITALQYDMEHRSDYTKHLTANLDTTPKTIFDLMQNYDGVWESSPVCHEMERLVEVGIAKFYSKGKRFQDHYFVIADKPLVTDSMIFLRSQEIEQTYQELVEKVLSFTKEEI